ncbi:MAG: EamA family transporter [Syntrophobacteraceae bacterium]|nr:EamA family transporter [Syntrophobacteraceae bacterium]
MKTALVVSLAVLAQAVANTLLSKGMKTVAAMPSFQGGFSPVMLAYALENPYIWGGIILLILFFACFLSAVSWSDLSYVVPITAAVYILDVFTGNYFLHEPVAPVRWLGSVLIVLGVGLVSLSGAGKSPSDEPACETVPTRCGGTQC